MSWAISRKIHICVWNMLWSVSEGVNFPGVSAFSRDLVNLTPQIQHNGGGIKAASTPYPQIPPHTASKTQQTNHDNSKQSSISTATTFG
jgi:hypothetical protein